MCTTCLSGLGNPARNVGVIRQLSLRYTNLIIDVTLSIDELKQLKELLNKLDL
ncbi:hypothetical protein NNC19_12945 [Clostridium sp. SHJSY1]|uniref:hypothetical protein n=1 Tax=Clostridium sp. SHJSY1 TaxID=2942483 RepID=UPI002875FB73|nr:hypothetical protein [Clostridium sp. SHJSY1]MDS0526592.1 hypothetical protein [Clostridium sp. SHJSY1]